MTDWRPIETAPRDGTFVLVYPPLWNGCTVSIAKFDNDEHARKPRPFWRRVDAFTVTDSRNNPPTHWMPQPEPPGATP